MRKKIGIRTESVWLRSVFSSFLLLLLCACSSVIDEQGYTHDPWEGFNRKVFWFNRGLDKMILKPAAMAYDTAMPEPLERGVSNFFSNLGDVKSFANCILQGKFEQSAYVLARILNNTVFGLCGFFDVATPMGNKKIYEDFGSTLAHYGVKSGPYIMLPLFGPSTLRDSTTIVVDAPFDPVAYVNKTSRRWHLSALKAVQMRANLLDVEKSLTSQPVDEYLIIRDSWLQFRQNQINHGEADEAQADSFDYLFEEED